MSEFLFQARQAQFSFQESDLDMGRARRRGVGEAEHSKTLERHCHSWEKHNDSAWPRSSLLVVRGGTFSGSLSLKVTF